MAPVDKAVEATLVSCEVCLKEIPNSEASVPEAAEYFVYFCGPDCYDRWAHNRPPVEQAQTSGS